MLKRIIILVFVLSALALLAMAPLNASASSANTQKLQATEQPTDPPVVGVTVVVGETPGTVPVTGGGGMSTTTLLLFGVVAVLGIAVVLGGMALISRRQ